jgi:hypothetical protein
VTLRSSIHWLFAIGLLGFSTAACNRAPENKEAVRQGVMDHLSKNTGLDLKSMDVELGNVTFEGNTATAVVTFKPKSSPDAGMTMNYKLDRQGTKWVVQQKAGGGAGHGAGMGDTPPPPDPGAHAPGAAPPPAGQDALPPGHPPVAPGGAKGGSSTDLPAGHPPVSGQQSQPKTK